MEEFFWVIKLVSGETLLSEVFNIDDKTLYVRDPVEVKAENTSKGTSLYMVPWIPFSDSVEYKVNRDSIITASNMNRYTKTQYGTVLLKVKIDDLKNKHLGSDFNDADYGAFVQLLDEIKKVSEEFKAKFDMSVPDFEEVHQLADSFKNKATFH